MSHIPRHVFASSAYGVSRTHELDLLVSYHTLAAAQLVYSGIDAQHLTIQRFDCVRSLNAGQRYSM